MTNVIRACIYFKFHDAVLFTQRIINRHIFGQTSNVIRACKLGLWNGRTITIKARMIMLQGIVVVLTFLYTCYTLPDYSNNRVQSKNPKTDLIEIQQHKKRHVSIIHGACYYREVHDTVIRPLCAFLYN